MKKALNNIWLWAGSLLMASSQVFANEGAAAAGGDLGGWAKPLAAGFGMALAVVAASTAQGRVAASYMDGVSRNPGAQKSMGTQFILGLVFIETLVLFTFAIIVMKL